MSNLTKHQVAKIETTWIEAAEASDYKKGTKAYKNAQAAYFAGAINALETVGISAPPIWEICILSGRDVITTK